MKKIAMTFLLIAASPAFAQFEGIGAGINQPAREHSDDPRVQRFIDLAYENDSFAGHLVTIEVDKKLYKIDRRAEPPKAASDLPTKALGDLIREVKVDSKGKLEAGVDWSQYPNGTIKDVHIRISITGSWEVGKEPGGPLPKTDEETGL